MNQFKRDLQDELQSLSLSDEKKQLIAKKVKSSEIRSKRESTWSYRFVLTTFTFFMVGFSYLFLRQEDAVKETSNAAEPAGDLSNIGLWLTSDWMKGIILVGIFIGIRIIYKKHLYKKGKGLPVCIACGEEWSYRESLKMSMKNEVVTCPNCKKKQYKTRKSSAKASMLNFLPPLGILVGQLFSHILLGFLIHIVGSIWLIIVLTPFLLEFQEEDPMIKPLY